MPARRTRRSVAPPDPHLEALISAELDQVIVALQREITRGKRSRDELFAWGQREYQRLLLERMRGLVDAVARPGAAAGGPLLVPFDLRRPLPGFMAIGEEFRGALERLQADCAAYLADPGRRRPFNVLVVAPPGSGKSYLAKCLGAALGAPVISANLSAATASAVLHHAVTEARNHKAVDRTPLLLLDEAESRAENLAMLLPLLWDGELFSEGRLLKIGRTITLCVVSHPDLVAFVRGAETASDLETRFPKVRDFVSRFNGGTFTIPSINEAPRRGDKIWMTMELVHRRAPSVRRFAFGFLRGVSRIRFTSDIRSLEAFLEALPARAFAGDLARLDAAAIDEIQAALERDGSTLAYHVADGARAIEELRTAARAKDAGREVACDFRDAETAREDLMIASLWHMIASRGRRR